MFMNARSAALTAALTLALPGLAAQRAPSPPSVLAITGARLVPVSGPVIERGTIVIRDGRITALGANVTAPADARVIDGAGLSIYPGLIDAASSLGVPRAATGGGGPGGFGGGGGAPPAASQQGTANSAYPVGQRPEVAVVDLLKADAAQWSSAHAAGITVAHAIPNSGMFRGQSAVIALGSGEVPALVVKAPIAQAIAFQGIRGAFPGSLMGVFAAMRQMFLDAQRYGAAVAAAARDPRGSPRPEWNPSLEALQGALAGTMPVVFEADTEREILRALDFAREFNLKPIIAGGDEAWKVAARLKAENVPVLLSLNFPKPTAAPAADADPEPIRVLQGRVDAPKGPGRLAAAGVRFAFTQGGGTSWSDHLPNMRRAVAAGLSPDAALRGHTLAAAQILGVADRFGSLEVGKAAHLAVVRGDIFDSTSRVTHVVVDGAVTELPAPAATAANGRPGGGARGPGGPGGPGATELGGTWMTTVAIEGTDHTVTIALRQDGQRLIGMLQGGLGVAQISHGELNADGEFRFTAPVTLRDGTEEAVFVGNLTGNAIRGGVSIVGHALGRFSGTRPAPAGTIAAPVANQPTTH